MYERVAGQYRDGAEVFFVALATHTSQNLAEVVFLDGQRRFRIPRQ